MSRHLVALVALLPLASPAGASGIRAVVEEVGEVRHPGLPEISGMVRSRAHPDVFWIHNDGGNAPRLFAIEATGEVIVPPAWIEEAGREGHDGAARWPGIEIWSAANVDWEDIAAGDGRLYIADVGNTRNARRDLGLYVLEEPDPRLTRALPPLRYVPVAYPDQTRWPAEEWHFDCEAVFFDGGRLYFLTKHRKPGRLMAFERGTNLYRLDTQHPERENLLVRLGSHDGVALATAADLSPSGGRLAVLTYEKLWLFDRPAEGDDWLSGHAAFVDLERREVKQNEAIAWIDEETLLMANEQRGIFRIRLMDAGHGEAAPPQEP